MKKSSELSLSQHKYFNKNNESFKNIVQETENQLKSSKKIAGGNSVEKQTQKQYVFSLNSFDKSSNRREKSESFYPKQKNIWSSTQLRESDDSDKESKRRIIYENQSYKQMDEEQKDISATVKSNNDIFSMVFLAKPSKNFSSPAETISTEVNSFSKQKNKIDQYAPTIQSPPQIVEETPISIQDFDVGKKLGAGKFGQVYITKHRASGFLCAIKKIQKSKIDSKLMVQLVRQIKIQIFLKHPNVVKMFTFFSDQKFIYLVMELCYSGQLYGFLKKKRRLGEDLTKSILQQICKALDYMHENEIIHRDLKPQNIIYQSGLMKICDFGWSISTNVMRGTFCGTPLYVSPELLKKKRYNNKIDVWSVGILTYQLLFGRVPFQIQTEKDFVKIVQDEIKFSKITKISQEAKDFILSCLQKDPRDRCTIPQLLEHPFLSKIENVSMLELY